MKYTPNDCPLDNCPHHAPEQREAMRQRITALEATNKELLEALKVATIVISQHYPQDTTCCADRIARIKAAIAKVKAE